MERRASALTDYGYPPPRMVLKMEGYGQSPSPLKADTVNFEEMKNQRKVQLMKIKRNLESQLKSIVHESKKAAHLRREYGDLSQEELNQSSRQLGNLRLELESLDLHANVHAKLTS